MRKALLAVAAAMVLAVAAVAYTLQARGSDEVATERLTLAPGQLFVRDQASGHIAAIPLNDPGAPRRLGELKCDRFAVARQTAVCLSVQPSTLPPIMDVLVLNADLTVRHRESLPGTPSRARVSPDGQLVSWTLFVTGDSYAATGFSTRSGVYDIARGQLFKSIEELPVFVSGQRYFASDVNYWGITFAPDGNRFYATLGSKGRTYLIEADYGRYQGKAVRENVECPSLSPDGTRVAFKKKVAEGEWRLSVLDLASLRETELAETRSVDDQALWQDESTILYGLGGDIWSVPSDGTGTPKRVVTGGSSPAVT